MNADGCRKPWAQAHPRARLRGFTLLEALVALVLTATVATLAMQILTHLARVERALEARTGGGASPLLREIWLRETLASATPLPAARGTPLRADERQLALPSFVRPGPSQGQPSAVLLNWRDEPGARQLMLATPGAVADESASTVLWQGPASSRWRFRAVGAEWRDTWPPPVPDRLANRPGPTETDQLPELVWIDPGRPADGAAPGAAVPPGVLVRLWTHPRPLPSRRALESL